MHHLQLSSLPFPFVDSFSSVLRFLSKGLCDIENTFLDVYLHTTPQLSADKMDVTRKLIEFGLECRAHGSLQGSTPQPAIYL